MAQIIIKNAIESFATNASATSLLLFVGLVPQFARGHFHWDESTSISSYISSCLFSTDARAIFSNAVSTPCLFLALEVKCLIFGCLARNSWTATSSTSLSYYLSILFPIKMKGNFSGSLGAPWLRNSVIQVSILSKDCMIGILRVCWWCHRRVRSNQRHDRMRLPNFWISTVQLYPRSVLTLLYLEVDYLAINYHLFFHEVCSHRRLVGLQKFLIDVTMWRELYAFSREVFPTLN